MTLFHMDHRELMLFVLLWGSVMSADVRLFGGTTPCSGELEQKQQGEWIAMTVKIKDWNLTAAAAMCRQLNCGSAVLTQRTPDVFFPGLADPIFTSLHFSTVTTKITCSDCVRLVDGTNRCSGRLEVGCNLSNKSWSAVHEHNFDQLGAQVVCRELGCGAPSLIQGMLYEKAPLTTKAFHCAGHESTLTECDSTMEKQCPSKIAVKLTCSEPDDMRLVGGTSRCRGTLEINVVGEWEQTNTLYWNLRLAGRVCGKLDCGSVISVGMQNSLSYGYRLSMINDCKESSLLNCFTKHSRSNSELEISCSDSVRLVNGTNTCSGRLQVNSDLEWSTVCAEDFTQQSAEVVCRELGCGAPSVFMGVFVREIETPSWKKKFQCGGYESVLQDCRSFPLGRKTCFLGKAVWISCSDPDEIRLVGGTSQCNGRPELKHNDNWRALDANFMESWGREKAAIICQRLGCGSPLSVARIPFSTPSTWWINTSCIVSSDLLKECVTINDIPQDSSIEISCSDTVRLINETSGCSGILAVKSNQSWSTVCEDDFDQHKAEVACSELGCGPPSPHQGGLRRDAVEEKILCEGHESALVNYKGPTSTRNNCSSSKPVTLTCLGSGNIRLMGKNSRCAGALEMVYKGDWRPVDSSNSEWDQKSAAVVCKLLGCGSAVSEWTTEEDPYRSVWFIDFSCVLCKSSLSECAIVTDEVESYIGLEVVCSDFITPNISLSSTFGVSKVDQQRFHVLLGSSFTIACSVQPQYQRGFFQLIFNDSSTVRNFTLPAVNHSARFLFFAADRTHQGDYSCVYHVNAFPRNFSSQSQTVGLTVLASLTELIIRLVVVLPGIMLLISALCFHTKARLQRPGSSYIAQM